MARLTPASRRPIRLIALGVVGLSAAALSLTGCEDPTGGNAASTGGRTSVPGRVMDRAEALEEAIGENQQEALDLIDEMNGVTPGADGADADGGVGHGDG